VSHAQPASTRAHTMLAGGAHSYAAADQPHTHNTRPEQERPKNCADTIVHTARRPHAHSGNECSHSVCRSVAQCPQGSSSGLRWRRGWTRLLHVNMRNVQRRGKRQARGTGVSLSSTNYIHTVTRRQGSRSPSVAERRTTVQRRRRAEGRHTAAHPADVTSAPETRTSRTM
jgi:hypothetical protein